MEVKFKNFCNRHIMLELPTIKTDFLFENSQDFNQTTHARPQHPIVFIHNISLYFNCISSVKYVFKRSRNGHVMPFSAVRPKPWNFQYGFQHTLKYLTWSSTQFSTWFIPKVNFYVWNVLKTSWKSILKISECSEICNACWKLNFRMFWNL